MKFINKACLIVTVGAVIGLRHHTLRSKSHTVWHVLGPYVSQAGLSPTAQEPSRKILSNAAKPKDIKEPLRHVAYLSYKVKEGTDFVPEMFDEQKDEVVIERILRVIFLNAERPTPALQKLKHQLAEAEVELELRKKPQVDTSPKVVEKGLVIDEWKE